VVLESPSATLASLVLMFILNPAVG
jgi:hypothetical protein